jgi:hypothetical protein
MKMLAAAILTLAAPAYAQEEPPKCADRTKLIEALADKYGEVAQGWGILSNGSLLELFVSEETGTWSILTTEPGGVIACFSAAGEMWDGTIETPAKGDPV